MSKRSQKPVKAAAVVPTGYGPLLAELKSRVRTAQVRAALSVNRELVALYWDIGRVILQRQQTEGWGAKVVARLAADLRTEFPEMKGFSRPNLLFMRAFAAAWSENGALPFLAAASPTVIEYGLSADPIRSIPPFASTRSEGISNKRNLNEVLPRLATRMGAMTGWLKRV